MNKGWTLRIVVLAMLAVALLSTSAYAESQYNVIVASLNTEYTVVVDYTRGGKSLTDKIVGPGSKTFSIKADSIDKVTYEKMDTNGTMRLMIKQDKNTLYDSGKFTKNVKAELTKKDMIQQPAPQKK